MMIFIFGWVVLQLVSNTPVSLSEGHLHFGVSGPTQGHLLETRYPGPSASSPLVHVGQDTFGGL